MKIDATNAMIDHHEKGAIQGSVHKAIFKAVVLAPIVEEIIFRGASNIAVNNAEQKNHTGTAVAIEEGSDALFGLAHAGFIKPNENRRPKVDLTPSVDTHALPLVPYIGGKQFRRIGKQRGFGYGVYAHSLNNLFEVARRAPGILHQKHK